jgi:uncharacterized protein (DUF305 family)
LIASKTHRQLAAAFIISAAAGCATAKDAPEHAHPSDSGMSMGMPEPIIPPGATYTAADVKFMQGMIPHHGQAIQMSQMAASHGASPSLLRFTLKIDLSQRAEINLMQDWLRNHKQAVPDSMAHLHMTMAGMLTPDQMKMLDSAKGPAFDKMFLEMMILHHEGALKMVADLFAGNGAREPDVFSLATDIDVVQRAEIEAMREMLANL